MTAASLSWTSIFRPVRSRIFSRLNGLLERLLLLDRLNDIYAEMDKREETGDFAGRALAALKIGYRVEPEDMGADPLPWAPGRRCKPSVRRRRGADAGRDASGGPAGCEDYGQLPAGTDTRNAPPHYSCRSFWRQTARSRRNLKPLREALAWIRDGGALAVFPAGEVSHLHLMKKQVVDPAWSEMVGRLIRKGARLSSPSSSTGETAPFFRWPDWSTRAFARRSCRTSCSTKRRREVRLNVGNLGPCRTDQGF